MALHKKTHAQESHLWCCSKCCSKLNLLANLLTQSPHLNGWLASLSTHSGKCNKCSRLSWYFCTSSSVSSSNVCPLPWIWSLACSSALKQVCRWSSKSSSRLKVPQPGVCRQKYSSESSSLECLLRCWAKSSSVGKRRTQAVHWKGRVRSVSPSRGK